jgi:hypothetical protein
MVLFDMSGLWYFLAWSGQLVQADRSCPIRNASARVLRHDMAYQHLVTAHKKIVISNPNASSHLLLRLTDKTASRVRIVGGLVRYDISLPAARYSARDMPYPCPHQPMRKSLPKKALRKKNITFKKISHRKIRINRFFFFDIYVVFKN